MRVSATMALHQPWWAQASNSSSQSGFAKRIHDRTGYGQVSGTLSLSLFFGSGSHAPAIVNLALLRNLTNGGGSGDRAIDGRAVEGGTLLWIGLEFCMWGF